MGIAVAGQLKDEVWEWPVKKVKADAQGSGLLLELGNYSRGRC
jgi:hypothetical protein